MGTIDLSVAHIPVIPCIFLWGVSFAGIFYAPGMHVPSVY